MKRLICIPIFLLILVLLLPTVGYLDPQVVAADSPTGEVVSQRTLQTKMWYLGSGTYKMQSGLGPVHYQDGGWQDIDNAWVASSVQPWNYEMTKDAYQAYAYSLFNWGRIMKFELGGSSVEFQPKDLQWTNALSQIETVSIPQSVNVAVNNTPVELLDGMSGSLGTLTWQNAYGTGRDFKWSAIPGLLQPLLTINSVLPTPPQFIIDGGNPMLRLSSIFAPSSSLDIYVNGQLWDKATTVQTVQSIEFRDGSTVLWYFYPAKCWSSGLNWTPTYIWTTPNSASGTSWINPSNAIDGNTVTFASISVPAQQWSNYLTLGLNGSRICDRVRINSNGGASVNAIQVDAFYNGAWTNIYNGALVKGSWQTYSIPAGNQTVTQARVRYWNSHASATRTAECHEFQFWASELPPEEFQTITTQLRKVGSDLWLDVLVPYKWLQTAVYPIYIDPDTGPTLPGLGSSEDTNPYVAAWANPTYIQTYTGLTYATRSIPAGEVTDTLRASQFGFSIGAGATITNVKMDFDRIGSVANMIALSYLYLVKNDSTNGGNKADGVFWPTVAAPVTYQGDSTYWGVTLTTTVVNSVNFGIRLVANNDDVVTRTASVDWVKITVSYTIVAPTLTTSAATNVAETTATLNGNVVTTGGENPTVTVYWGNEDGGTTPASWDFNSAPTSPAQPQGVAAFYKDVNSLLPSTLYYFTARGVNSGGTGWATTKNFTTASACSPNITLNSSSWSINGGSPVATSSNYATGIAYFRITNNSGGTVNITIGGTDMVGGNSWDLADSGSPENMIYGMYAGLDDADDLYDIIVRETADYNILVGNLADDATQDFGLKLWTPTVYTDGVAKSGNITLTVACI